MFDTQEINLCQICTKCTRRCSRCHLYARYTRSRLSHCVYYSNVVLPYMLCIVRLLYCQVLLMLRCGSLLRFFYNSVNLCLLRRSRPIWRIVRFNVALLSPSISDDRLSLSFKASPRSIKGPITLNSQVLHYLNKYVFLNISAEFVFFRMVRIKRTDVYFSFLR